MYKNQVNIRGPYTLASKAALFMLHWTSKNLKIKYFFYIFWNAFQIPKYMNKMPAQEACNEDHFLSH